MRRTLIQAGLFAVSIVLLSACDVLVAEVGRVTSSDGKVDLVVSITDGGATTGVGYYVNLVPARGKADLDASIFIADRVIGFEAYWRSSETVVIECSDARVFHFANFWQAREVDNFRHIVQIRLSGGCIRP